MNLKRWPIQLLVIGVIIATCFAFLTISAFVFVLINKPVETVEPLVPTETLEFEDNGNKIIFFDVPATGPVLFSFGHRGDSSFLVRLLDNGGSFIEPLVAASGNYDSDKIRKLDAGSYMLEITADGYWFVFITPSR